jgi:hypothetical protein
LMQACQCRTVTRLLRTRTTLSPRQRADMLSQTAVQSRTPQTAHTYSNRGRVSQ